MKKVTIVISLSLLIFTYSDLYCYNPTNVEADCNPIVYEPEISEPYLSRDRIITINEKCTSFNTDWQSVNLSSNRFDQDLFRNRIIPIFMIVAGISIAGIWTTDFTSGKFSDQGSFFDWREGENMLWPHIAAEFFMSIGLVVGGMGLFATKDWGLWLSLVSLGALVYSAVNSSGWVIAEKSRLLYGVPVWFSLTGAIISIVIIISS